MSSEISKVLKLKAEFVKKYKGYKQRVYRNIPPANVFHFRIIKL